MRYGVLYRRSRSDFNDASTTFEVGERSWALQLAFPTLSSVNDQEGIRTGTNRHRAADVIYCIQRLWGWFDIQRCTAGIAVWRFDLIHETVRRIDTVCAQSASQRVGIVPFASMVSVPYCPLMVVVPVPFTVTPLTSVITVLAGAESLTSRFPLVVALQAVDGVGDDRHGYSGYSWSAASDRRRR